MKKNFSDLSEKELLALAITAEEEDSRIYDDYADSLMAQYPDTAAMFKDMAAEESRHRHRLLDLYHQKFGGHIPLIRRQDVKGFIEHRPPWLTRTQGIEAIRAQAGMMEAETRRFYLRAAQKSADVAMRQLLGDLAAEERRHENLADALEAKHVGHETWMKEDTAERQLFVLQIVQPSLAGLMDGSVSTLAPLFAAAFATHSSWDTFLVGLAASIGAGISMGFAEALSDNGSLTGRGSPWLRGGVCGLMTTLGGLGHTLPYLIPDFWTATIVAFAVVLLELGIISWIRNKYMDTPLLSAAFQVMAGGVLVFLTGILIGSA
jgi:erythrin-vacuolar iron transport family protein